MLTSDFVPIDPSADRKIRKLVGPFMRSNLLSNQNPIFFTSRVPLKIRKLVPYFADVHPLFFQLILPKTAYLIISEKRNGERKREK